MQYPTARPRQSIGSHPQQRGRCCAVRGVDACCPSDLSDDSTTSTIHSSLSFRYQTVYKIRGAPALRPNAHRVSRRWQSIQPRRPMDTCMQQPLSSHPCDETSKQASKQTRLRVCLRRQLSRSQYGSSLLKSVTNVLLASKPGQPVLP